MRITFSPLTLWLFLFVLGFKLIFFDRGHSQLDWLALSVSPGLFELDFYHHFSNHIADKDQVSRWLVDREISELSLEVVSRQR